MNPKVTPQCLDPKLGMLPMGEEKDWIRGQIIYWRCPDECSIGSVTHVLVEHPDEFKEYVHLTPSSTDIGLGVTLAVDLQSPYVSFEDRTVKQFDKQVLAEKTWKVIKSNLADRGCFNDIDDDVMEELELDVLRGIDKVFKKCDFK